MTITQEKSELRARILARRKEISPKLAELKSRMICEALTRQLKLSWLTQKDAQNSVQSNTQESGDIASLSVAVFAPLRYEVNITPFIETLYELGCTVSFPSLNAHCPERPMDMRVVSYAHYKAQDAPFITDPIHAYTPQDDAFPVTDPATLDVVLVPLFAFDFDGMRLGYGGGNYDRYMPLLDSTCRTIGIAFSEQLTDAVPHDQYDIALPSIMHA